MEKTQDQHKRKWWADWWPGRGKHKPETFLTMAEPYRRLAVRLHFDLASSPGGRCLMLTCPSGQEVTEEAIRLLAAYLAEEQGDRVLIVDACFNKGSLSAEFQIPKAPGLLNILNGAEPETQSIIHPTGHPNVFFLAPGESGGGPRRLLMSPSLEQFLIRMRDQFDFVLINTPSLLQDASSLPFPSLVECVLLLVFEGVTRSSDVQACHTALENCKAQRVESVFGSL